MKLLTIWIQSGGRTWIEDAWDDQSVAENIQGWRRAVDSALRTANANSGIMRVIVIDVPDEGIFDAFTAPEVAGTATPVPDGGHR